jgi:hypothetical protein
MSHLLKESAAYRVLRRAILDFFDPALLRPCLRAIGRDGRPGVKLGNFDDVLPYLSDQLGGSFDPRRPFATSATELYTSLNVEERERLVQLYGRKVEEVTPAVRREFPSLF